MNKETLKALKGSIKKWEGIVDGRLSDKGPDNCPLCKKFYDEMDGCDGCPVKQETDHDYCEESPYFDWCEATAWKHDCKAADDETVMCAVLELEFLKSLLPRKKK